MPEIKGIEADQVKEFSQISEPDITEQSDSEQYDEVSGVLEVLPDGYGFLRTDNYSYGS